MLATATKHWYSLSWVEWVGVVGLPLTLLGLYLTWWQANRAFDAAEAARKASIRTQRQMRANQLIVLVPQLRWISSELDAAIQENNVSLARRHLDSWRGQASHIHGILSNAEPDEVEVLKKLQASVGQAATASAALLGPNGGIKTNCMKARTAIASVCDDLNAWVGKNSTQVTE
jgi:hypothetical protein